MMKKFLSVILALVCAACLPLAASSAAGASVVVAASPRSVSVGDTVSVQVKFVASGENISTLSAAFSYDSDKLEFLMGGNAVGASAGKGGISDSPDSPRTVLEYELRFRAKQAGTASFSLTSSEVVGEISGQSLGSPKKSISIEISEGGAATDPEDPQETGAQDPQEDPIEVKNGDETLYLMRTFGEELLPSGFSMGEIDYEGQAVSAGRNAAGAVVVYMLNATGEGSLYLYEEGRFLKVDTLHIFAAYILIQGAQAPAGFEPTVVKIADSAVDAWKDAEGRIVLYALGPSGRAGYYFYDAQDGSMLRAEAITQTASQPETPEPTPTPQPAPEEESGPSEALVIAILGAALCVLAVSTVLLSQRYQRAKRRARRRR